MGVASVLPAPGIAARPLLRFALGAGGWAAAGLVVYWGLAMGRLPIPGGDTLIFAAAGRAFMTGGDVYALDLASMPFFYAPPWAALLGLFPNSVTLHIAVVAVNLVALRYIARSWLAVGYLGWFPLVPWEAVGGQLNVLLAAGIVAAVRGHGAAAAALGLSKWSPFLALSPRAWRGVLGVLALALLITLPRLDLWVAWAQRLWWGTGHPYGPLIPIPALVRFGTAALLIAWRRPWSRALGAAIATPAFYWVSLVLLIAPIAVWVEGGAGWPFSRRAPVPAKGPLNLPRETVADLPAGYGLRRRLSPNTGN
jgi:hypothetical protein